MRGEHQVLAEPPDAGILAVPLSDKVRLDCTH